MRIFNGIAGLYLIWISGTLLYTVAAAGQANEVLISVTRADTKQPMPDVIIHATPVGSNVKVKQASVGFTDAEGKYRFAFIEPVVLHLSYLGFSSLTDTLYNAAARVYQMKPVAKDMADLVITGQYAPGSAKNSLYEVKVINQDVLKAKGANNLREALQNELHIDLGQDQVFGSSLSINGISGEGIKIMVDGVPIVGRSDGKIDLSQINLSNIDRIEVVEGPLSVMYGADALGGVINIITKTYQQEKINLNFKTYYESVGQYNAEMYSGFTFGKNQIYLSGGRYFFDGFSTVDTLLRFQEWKPREQYFADAKYIHSRNRFRYSVLGSFFREIMWNRSAPRVAYDGNDWIYAGDDTRYLTYRPRVSTSLMYRFKDNYQMDLLLGYSGFMRYNNQYIKNLVKGTMKLVNAPDVHDTTFYHHVLFRGTYSMPAWNNRLQFLFGTEVNQEFTRQNRIAGKQRQAGDYAAYGSMRINITKGLDIQPAVRFSYNTLFNTPLIPSLHLRYAHKNLITCRASYGRGYRAPSLKELFLLFFDSNHSLKGNEQLLPEDGHTVNSSFDYTPQIQKIRLRVGASGFYNFIRNKIDWRIVPSPGPEPDTFQYFNIKNYSTTGGDVHVGYDFSDWSVQLSGMLTHYRLMQSKTDITRMNSIDITASTTYKIPKAQVQLFLYYKYNGAKPVFSINNSLQSGRRDAFHSLDASLSRAFWKNRIQVQAGVRNILNVTNVGASGIAGVGHNFNPNAVNMLWGRTVFASLVIGYAK
ncbi:MAG: TonB-dependent receptor [Chitinophagales bacterium]|nr:TonB-dependent receptor [Chitinophagales bacterium]MDW8418370.1 TonB-dependent receptor [Chitinophagales bacterium]